jgi:mannose-1-phosphate guanylyltransferase
LVARKKVMDAFVTDICKLDLFTGTRFRPLSLDIPKPLFPVAGLPLIQHHIEACIALKELKEILLIGFYPAALIQQFVNDLQHRYNVTIR